MPSPTGGRAVVLAIVASVVFLLWWMRELIAPLVLATLIASVLFPAVRMLERHGVRRWLASVIVVAAAFAAVVATLWVAGVQMAEVLRVVPQYRANILAKIRDSRLPELASALDELQGFTWLSSETGDSAAERAAPVRVVDPSGALAMIRAAVEQTLRPLAVAGLITVVVLFMLLKWDDLRDRIIRLVSRGRITLTTRALDELSLTISVVLRTQLAINLGVGAIVGISLWAMGVPGGVLWGLLTAVLRFVPYLGMVTAAAMPSLNALAVSEGWFLALAIVGLYLAVELVTGNFVEPLALGARAHVTTLSLLISAAFWTWLWGLPGLFLSTPITVGLAVIGRHVPQLEFLDVLLGDSPVLPPAQRIYQRLVAQDQADAQRLLVDYAKTQGVAAALEQLILPVIQQTELDRRNELMEPERAEWIFGTLRAMVAELAPQSPQDASGTTRPVVCVPARTESDAAAATVISSAVSLAGIPARALDLTDLGEDLGEVLASLNAGIVCIVALQPMAERHAGLRERQLAMRAPGAACVWYVGSGLGVSAKSPAVLPLQAATPGVRSASELSRLVALLAESPERQRIARPGGDIER